MDGFVALALEEERQLAAALSKNPIYIKLEAVRALLRAYGDDPAVPEKAVSVPHVAARPAIKFEVENGRSKSVAGQVRSIVIPYLEEKGVRVQSNRLLDLIQDRGVVLGGQNPIATLSSYLSGTPELDNIRGQGYGLKKWSEATEEVSAPSDHTERRTENENTEADEMDSGKVPSAASEESSTQVIDWNEPHQAQVG